jgi:hypothetical protein
MKQEKHGALEIVIKPDKAANGQTTNMIMN